MKIHLGVEQDFRPARKAHPAFLVGDLGALIEHLRESGYDVLTADLADTHRAFTFDPFGNRIELIAWKRA